MNKDIDIRKIKSYADDMLSLYDEASQSKFDEWFNSEGYQEIIDSTEELLGGGLIDHYINNIL